MRHSFQLSTQTALLAAILFPLLVPPAQAQSLQVGDLLPSFEVVDEQGNTWKSADHIGHKTLVVFFYPSDFSFCCTKQAEKYRDGETDLAKFEIEVVGISCDSQASHELFKAAHGLKFSLLTDGNGDVARQFGVPLRAGGKAIAHEASGKALLDSAGEPVQFPREWTAGRCTFVVGKDGRIVHRDAKVSPISDCQTIVKLVSSLGQK
jgi:peroxiredoxin Q/BCP